MATLSHQMRPERIWKRKEEVLVKGDIRFERAFPTIKVTSITQRLQLSRQPSGLRSHVSQIAITITWNDASPRFLFEQSHLIPR